MSVAIFGGSFDPVHIGHEKVVIEALKTLKIKKIILLLAYRNPFKGVCFAPSNLRLRWLNTTFCSYENVEISSFEMDKNRAVTTYESIKHFKKYYEKIYLIIGADNYSSLHKWANYEKLSPMVEFVIASRDKLAINTSLKVIDIDIDVSSTNFRSSLKEEYIPKAISEEVCRYYEGVKCKKP